nr:hypothetical transcript [Hymenolepis microstoma]
MFVNSTSPWYGFADRLYFHYFSGTENLKAKTSRATSQIVVVRLSSLSSLRLPDQASLADYNKIFVAVSRLASNLGCRISKGLTSIVASNSSSNNVSQTNNNTGLNRDEHDNKKENRLVKFRLPSTKGTSSAPESLPTRFEPTVHIDISPLQLHLKLSAVVMPIHIIIDMVILNATKRITQTMK